MNIIRKNKRIATKQKNRTVNKRRITKHRRRKTTILGGVLTDDEDDLSIVNENNNFHINQIHHDEGSIGTLGDDDSIDTNNSFELHEDVLLDVSSRMIRCQETIKTIIINLNDIFINFYNRYSSLFPHLVKKNQTIKLIGLNRSTDEISRLFKRNALVISSIIESMIMTNEFSSILTISRYFRSMLQEQHDAVSFNQRYLIDLFGGFGIERRPFLVERHRVLDTFEKKYKNVLEGTIKVAITRLKVFLFNYAYDHYMNVPGLTDTYLFSDEILNGTIYDNRYIAEGYDDEDEGKMEEGDGREEKDGDEREERNFGKRKFGSM